jgi:protein-L-isoaspartate(D-aspartate) O-methyltransferase
MRFVVALLLFLSIAAQAQNYSALRQEMVDDLKSYAMLVRDPDTAPFSDSVLLAMNVVERHRMVPQSQQRYAYENRPLPIGHGQTISQPYIVALMTELVRPRPDDVILEVGTGSGYRLGDGYFGWEEHAPFDAIVVTAAASHVPPPLIEQLKPGGLMVIPVGGRFTTQTLLLLEKTEDGEIITRQYGAVLFVPLTGEH